MKITISFQTDLDAFISQKTPKNALFSVKKRFKKCCFRSKSSNFTQNRVRKHVFSGILNQKIRWNPLESYRL
jgi:hypothetical protein